MPGFDNNTMYADNVDFRGVSPVVPQVTTDGQLLIGSTASPNIKVGTLGSSDSSITWTVGSGTITGQVAGGATVLKTLTPNSGGVQSPTAGNINMLGTGSITSVGSGSTITNQLTGLTNHAVLVGAGTSTITKLGVGTNGQVLIGATTADPAFATLTSSDSSLTFTTGINSLSLQVAGGTTVGKTITGDSGGALSPTAGNWNILGTGSITTSGAGSSLTNQLTGLTNHAVLIGAGTATITKVGPVASTGAVLMSNGLAADPGFSTATYPAIATGTGTILRADGTNWVATTSTYPNTNAINTLLYASAANVMSALATANSGVLTTSATGVPSIDTTNFAVLTTGVQMKGNNTNTAPPAGFIGEQIRGFLAVGSSVTVVTATAKTVTSITLTPGIWDISAVLVYNPAAITGVQTVIDISTTTNTLGGTSGDSQIQLPTVPTSSAAVGLTIPSFRVTIASNTTYFLIAFATFSAGTLTANGRISGTRVG